MSLISSVVRALKTSIELAKGATMVVANWASVEPDGPPKMSNALEVPKSSPINFKNNCEIPSPIPTLLAIPPSKIFIKAQSTRPP